MIGVTLLAKWGDMPDAIADALSEKCTDKVSKVNFKKALHLISQSGGEVYKQ